MSRKIIRRKKIPFFICQITENAIKIVKILSAYASDKPVNAASEYEVLTGPLNDAQVAEKLARLLKKMGYAHEPVIVSLPRSAVTSRYLKVPAQATEEIEKIVSLQASRLIPYSADELNTGFEIIQTDREGFSEVNAIIVLKGVIVRYLKMFEALKPADFSVGLSSSGLSNLYGMIAPADNSTVMLIDIDMYTVELAIIQAKKALFSRSIKLSRAAAWEDMLVEEITKTTDAYLKEVSGKGAPEKIVIITAQARYQSLIDAIAKKIKVSAEQIPYLQNIGLPENAVAAVVSSNLSFASLFGLSLEEIPSYANLLPAHLKEAAQTKIKGRQRLRIALSLVGIIGIAGLATEINLKHKEAYLAYLKRELDKISKEAKTLESIEEKFQLLADYSKKRISSLDILYELHRTIPAEVSLLTFSYDDGNELTIRGRAPDLNLVFGFVSSLQNSPLLIKFTTKVRYATQKKTQAGEVVDFEISCLKGT